MKKFLSGLFGVIFVLIIAAVLIVFFGWSRVPDWLASRLEEQLQVHVSIDDLHVSWESIDIQKLEVGNPSGYTLPKAFSAEQILIQAPATVYLHDRIIIDQLEIDNIYVGLEFDKQGSKRGNWTVLMKNLKEHEQRTGGHGKSVLIKKLILNNLSITLAYRDGSKKPQKLKTIKHLEFDNVTSEEGLPTDQIANIIMREMLKSIFTLENLGNMLEGFLESPTKGVDNLVTPFKKIFGM